MLTANLQMYSTDVVKENAYLSANNSLGAGIERDRYLQLLPPGLICGI